MFKWFYVNHTFQGEVTSQVFFFEILLRVFQRSVKRKDEIRTLPYMKPVLSFSNRPDLLKTITAVFSKLTDKPLSIQYSYNRFIMHWRLRGYNAINTRSSA